MADPGFRPVNVTATRAALWTCGVGEGIASSTDAQHWQVKHHVDSGGALLLGMGFTSDTFGYAYGTSGTVLTTTDGGSTWSPQKFGTDTILQASFADAGHGLIRTQAALSYLNGDGTLHAIHEPADVLQRFPYTASLVALAPEKMAILLSQGPGSEAGFLTTIDGGKTWSFHDPPNTGIASFVRADGSYWASGHEVVDKDKPGGGRGVALAMHSADGLQWQHTANDVHECQAQNCGACTASGCLASDSLIVNFYGATTRSITIPRGSLTSKWAAIDGHICTVGSALNCAATTEAKDTSTPGGPRPTEQVPKPLNAAPSAASVLNCILCGIDPIYVDEKLEGRIPVPVSFTVRADGTVEAVDVKDIASEGLKKKLASQIGQWLFEPPIQNGKPTQVSTNSTLTITVMRSQ
ncbi:hypothetical protein [Edaphobacter modestus]|uniref:hypothetical protein n=1 Tax=Edaphobacter modestus TaxID=388466 RepID=UPI0013EE9E89|nr:hypothetical protein [Edaphobacter modestus]